jgi:hypothetical protein
LKIASTLQRSLVVGSFMGSIPRRGGVFGLLDFAEVRDPSTFFLKRFFIHRGSRDNLISVNAKAAPPQLWAYSAEAEGTQRQNEAVDRLKVFPIGVRLVHADNGHHEATSA